MGSYLWWTHDRYLRAALLITTVRLQTTPVVLRPLDRRLSKKTKTKKKSKAIPVTGRGGP
jgi:hypothetical protein